MFLIRKPSALEEQRAMLAVYFFFGLGYNPPKNEVRNHIAKPIHKSTAFFKKSDVLKPGINDMETGLETTPEKSILWVPQP